MKLVRFNLKKITLQKVILYGLKYEILKINSAMDLVILSLTETVRPPWFALLI